MVDWTTKRQHLNHDCLKNQFIQSVNRFIRTLEGRVIDEGFAEIFISHLSSTWSVLEAEILELISRLEEDGGPADWFKQLPLTRLRLEDLSWMQSLLRSEWQKQGSTRVTAARVRSAASLVKMRCCQLEQTFASVYGKPMAERELLGYAVTLHQACQNLSFELSKLSIEDPINTLAKFETRETHEK
jgi:hypothetical protein